MKNGIKSKSAVILSTAFAALFILGQPALADNSTSHMQGSGSTEKTPHEHKLGTGSENSDLFEKLSEGKSNDKHAMGNSENGEDVNETLPKGDNADGHHYLEKLQKR